jgi:solute carrier family 1 (high affinity glutamate transporter) protein 2
MSTVPQDAESEAENQRLITEEASIRVCRRRWTRHLGAVGRWTRSNLLLVATFLSVVVGIILGLSIHQADPGRAWIAVLSLPGELFLRMLKMLILPLIIFSLMAGLGSLDTKVAASLGWRTVAYYLTTTVVAAVLGLALVMIIRPGERWRVEKPCDNSSLSVGGHNLETLDSVLDLLRNLFPDNLIVAMFQQTQTVYTEETVTSWSKCLAQNNETFTNCSAAVETVESLDLDCSNATRTERQVGLGNREGTNVLGIIVFTVVFSVFLSRQGERGRPVVEAIATLNEVIMSIVRLVMWFSPVGIASIIMGELLEVEDFVALVQQIGLYMVTVLLGLFIHGCIILPLLFMVLTRSNPLKLMRHTAQALLTAFGTSSRFVNCFPFCAYSKVLPRYLPLLYSKPLHFRHYEPVYLSLFSFRVFPSSPFSLSSFFPSVSSSAALPVTIQCLEEKAGVDSRVTRFMLPVGATINMDGTALYEAVAVVFIAQVEGINTDFATILIIW